MLGYLLVVASALLLRYSAIDKWYCPGRRFWHLVCTGLMGSCAVGVCAALFVHIVMVSMPTLTTATRSSKRIVEQLTWETHHQYTKHIGKRINVARQSRT